MKYLSSLGLLVLITLVCSCTTEPQIAEENAVPNVGNFDYSITKFPAAIFSDLNFNNNNGGVIFDPKGLPGNNGFGRALQGVSITNEGAALGRVLFYDTKLSINNSVACATCHKQELAFSDGKALSPGFEGKVTSRSSMAIINPAFQNNLFWDSRAKTIKELSLGPVKNHIEMGMEDLTFLSKKLSNVPYYKSLFINTYGTEDITPDRISNALSEFVGSLSSADSKFDRMSRNEASFTQLEKDGMAIFKSKEAKCASCHAGVNFSAADGQFDEYGGGQSFEGFGNSNSAEGTANIGLDLINTDKGRNDKFKIPTLRNVALTAPYMHDGRFKNLRQVVDHYSEGIKAHPSLDNKFKDAAGRPKGLNLNDYEKEALIAFLKTLTDDKFTSDPKYSNPFKK